METRILQPTPEHIRQCAQTLTDGGLVAFPTETVYGLGGNAWLPDAAKRIYEAKGRPCDNPLIVHLYDRGQLDEVACRIPAYAVRLLDRFTPGPLTLVFGKQAAVPPEVTGRLSTVAVRFPSHPVARELLRACGVPVCAPSANTSTRPSPTVARHVYDDLQGKIPYILDGGSCDIGVESTIVDASGDRPRILRLGGLSREELEDVAGKMEVVRQSQVALCPGMKYKHYAPKANVLFSAYYSDMAAGICRRYDEAAAEGKNPVILCLSDNASKYGNRNVMRMGHTYQTYAHRLFYNLRAADEQRFDTVLAEGVPDGGIGAAIINRLIKSSGGQII